MSKPIPETSQEKCKEYKTTIRNCNCYDKRKKSGSYKIQGLIVCKHQAHQILKAFSLFDEYKTTQSSLNFRPFCECQSFIHGIDCPVGSSL